MEIKIRKNDNNVYLLELSGTMDLNSAEQLKGLVMKIVVNKAERLIIDLKSVDKINSASIGALIYISSTLKKINCPFIIIATEGPALDALEATRLKSYFLIAQSLKEALALPA
jgi:anti-anti-sigma factor